MSVNVSRVQHLVTSCGCALGGLVVILGAGSGGLAVVDGWLEVGLGYLEVCRRSKND